MSIAIFIISFAGIDLGQELKFFGFEISINNSIVLYISIWIMLIYFLIRYISYFSDLDPKFKDYSFPNYPFNGYHEKYYEKKLFSLNNIFKFSVSLAVFLTHFLIDSLLFILFIVFKKNFLETLFPIIFAFFVILTSYNSPFVNSKKEDAFNTIRLFNSAIYDRTIREVILMFDKELFEYKMIINEHSNSLIGKSFFIQIPVSNNSTDINYILEVKSPYVLKIESIE